VASSPIPDLLSAEDWLRLVNALRLTRREADILRCVFYDERSASLARSLQLSQNTVHAYRERLFRKLDVESMTQAIAHVFAVYVMLHRANAADDQAQPRIAAELQLPQLATPKRP
jgi:DNA-binding CsgD family transcriptional regulator